MKQILKIIFIFLLLSSCGESEDDKKIKPIYKDISEYVYASVDIVSANNFTCKSSRSGIVQDIFVEKGMEVKKGQLLFTVSPTAEFKNRLSNAEVNLKDAKDNLLGYNSKLKNVEVEIKRSREKNSLDSINYNRKIQLWNKGIGSKNDLEQTRLNYQNSTSLLELQELKYKQTKIDLSNKYELAKNRLSTERELLNDLEINAEIDGVVFDIFKEKGELITSQEIFAQIGSSKSYEISMNIDEVDISKIELGDTAIIQLEAYADKVYTSLISYISETKDNATQTFEVEAVFLEKPKKLYNGLSGEANILVDRRKNAIVIPSDYILNRNSVLTENGPIEVKTGVKNLEYIEILEGLDSTTFLLKPDTE